MSLTEFHRHAIAVAAVALAVVFAPGAAPAGASLSTRVPAVRCQPRLLVLSAFPAELDAVLSRTELRRPRSVDVGGHRFYLGRVGRQDVALALTGIGLVNAARTTQVALAHFRCGAAAGISGIVFSGVAGGRYIGDVTVPSRWTSDGKTWYGVDRAMFATARTLARGVSAHLQRTAPVGDPACACVDPDLIQTVPLDHRPTVVVGGAGQSADPFGGRALPCVPGGGDVFGCAACRDHSLRPAAFARLLTGALPFLDPDFFRGYFAAPPAAQSGFVAQDMESAAVDRVATAAHVPFIAFRAVSDGAGDPLMLPGFPAQFFFYRQLAADNAATMTVAFLLAWTPGPAG